MNKIIEVKGLYKNYDLGSVPTQALRGIDLEIEKGTFSAIVGPSGHGKSTLLHLLGGLDRPSKGEILIQGQDIARLSDSSLARFRGEKLGFVFQFFNLMKGLNLLENVELPMYFTGKDSSKARTRATELLVRVGLGEKLKAKANELSGGQMQRVAIARALANDPEIILMDEPTGNLDSQAEAEIVKVILELKDQGKTIILVTHNPELAQLADRIITIKDGQIQ